MELFSFVSLLCVLLRTCSSQSTEEAAQQWLSATYNPEAQLVKSHKVNMSWIHDTDITEEHQNAAIEAEAAEAEFDKLMYEEAQNFDLAEINDEKTKRELRKILDIGEAVLSEEDFEKYSTTIYDMTTIYNTGQVCQFGRSCETNSEYLVDFDPYIPEVFATSRNYQELLHYWVGWRDATGKKMREDYKTFIGLSNLAAETNGYKDTGDYWRSWYEERHDPSLYNTLREDVEQIWRTVEPLYIELHAYMRNRLALWYGEEKVPRDGPIPAHILGNIWAQTWDNIYDMGEPYPGVQAVDVTDAMVEQGYTAEKMFEISEEFFTSLGLIEMPDEFWNYSMIVKPSDRDVVCYASAWDFYNQVDFRIKQCTEVTMGWLSTTHHEMGHVEYYLQYKEQPVKFRRGANPGFHEAIGDVMTLSVETPAHLHKIGLLDTVTDNDEASLNFLFKMALDKIAFLPFGYMIDQWRWDVFEGSASTDKMNGHWWNKRCQYQGIQPPVARTEDDFDPGAKFHIPNNTPYIRYFVSFIIQFQFHEALCKEAGVLKDFHKCDIYQSTAAGTKLANALKLGSSVPWSDAMEAITGQRTMDAQPLMNYFQPLTDWLTEQNNMLNADRGWVCPDYTQEPTAPPPTDGSSQILASFSLFLALLF